MAKHRRRRQHPARQATSVSEFVGVIDDLLPNSDDLLFRGQSQDWPLLPKIARITLRSGMDLLATERSLLEEFKLQAPSLVDLVPETDWEWLSLAQHYGMATRLLDWTTNPLAALWFTVHEPPVERKPGVVWVFDPAEDDQVRQSSATSPFTGERTRVLQPKHIAKRIIAQSGWFTVHKYLRKRKAFVPLERQSRYQSVLTKITVPSDAFASIRYGLAQCGVNAASLLTDLVGICAHLEWRHSLLADETDEVKANSVLRGAPLKRRR
jgi:hypothetical protein